MKNAIEAPIETGLSTLLALEQAHQFNAWMFGEIQPYLKGKVLEIGSGIGNISSLCIGHGIPLSISDYDPHYLSLLRQKFGGNPSVEGIYGIDLSDTAFQTTYNELQGSFDTVFALNVVEHIQDDRLAIRNCHWLLRPGGRLVILVPALPMLYNRLDKGLEHYRRYSTATLRQLLSGPFDVKKMRYFNLAGIGGWWLIGTLLRRKVIGGGRAKIYNRLVPLLRLADKLSFHRLGLSLVVVGEKKR
ncbi:MAG TPA: class I SAM-dependent methyltransferase [Puia sp.]